MIKFFRRIRQRLLTGNKPALPADRFSRYFLYAMGEILLVVVGILMALQINNWAQSKSNSTKERFYINNLKTDLKSQINEFNIRIGFYDEVIRIGETVLAEYSEKQGLVRVDSLNFKLHYLMYVLRFPEYNTTFNELNTTGQINLIKNDSLRSQIIEYYQFSTSQHQSVDNNIQVFYDRAFPIIQGAAQIDLEYFGYRSEIVDQGILNEKLASRFEKNLNNEQSEYEILNAIGIRIIIANINRQTVEMTKNTARALLADLLDDKT